MDNPDMVMKVVDEARMKKQKTSGIMLPGDTEQSDWERSRSLYDSLDVPKLTTEQDAAFHLIKQAKNVFIGGSKVL
jgi:hypothetical protein